MSAVAGLVGVPDPILLVVGGLVLGLIPGVSRLELQPEIVFLLFLPPLLYFAAYQASLRDLRADLRAISLLAFGLVLVTVAVVAAVARLLVPGLPWAVAFALGAIVSPTDPVAATAIMRRLGAPRRIATVVEGESLINDATAIVVLRVAVAAAAGSARRSWRAARRRRPRSPASTSWPTRTGPATTPWSACAACTSSAAGASRPGPATSPTTASMTSPVLPAGGARGPGRATPHPCSTCAPAA